MATWLTEEDRLGPEPPDFKSLYDSLLEAVNESAYDAAWAGVNDPIGPALRSLGI